MEIDLRRLVDAPPGLAWIVGAGGEAEILGKGWLDYTGLTALQAAGAGWRQSVHPEDAARLAANWEAAFKAVETGEVEARLRRADGAWRWFLFRAFPLPGPAGGASRWCASVIDIDERVLARHALAEQQRSFQRIIDGLPAMVALYATDGRITFSNQRMLDYNEQTLEQLQQGVPAYIYHPDDRELILTRWRAAVRSGETFDCEGRIMRAADGAYRWHRVHIFPLMDGERRISLWYGLFTDIDDAKRAEAKLAAEKELLEMVAGGASLPQVLRALCLKVEGLDGELTCSVLLVDQHGQVFRLGAAPSLPPSLVAALEGGAVDPGDGPAALAAASQTTVTVADLAGDTRWEPDGGPSRAAALGFGSCRSTPVMSSSHQVLAVFTAYRRRVGPASESQQALIDWFATIAGIAIERTQADEALGRARAELAHVSRAMTLSVLTASIAHEVNQPLSGIITNAGTCLRLLAADPPNVDAARTTVQRTIRDGNRAAEVIQRLRRLFSRQEPSFEPVDLSDAAREVLALSAGELQRRRVAFRADLANDLPPVLGDRVQLQQVILNLVLNAADAMGAVEEPGREFVALTAREGADAVRLSLSDRGVGFDPDAAERLFDAFYTTKGEGMGVGLSISRSIIESHDGRLWASVNEDGPGATFSFTVPCAQLFGPALAGSGPARALD